MDEDQKYLLNEYTEALDRYHVSDPDEPLPSTFSEFMHGFGTFILHYVENGQLHRSWLLAVVEAREIAEARCDDAGGLAEFIRHFDA